MHCSAMLLDCSHTKNLCSKKELHLTWPWTYESFISQSPAEVCLSPIELAIKKKRKIIILRAPLTPAKAAWHTVALLQPPKMAHSINEIKLHNAADSNRTGQGARWANLQGQKGDDRQMEKHRDAPDYLDTPL